MADAGISVRAERFIRLIRDFSRFGALPEGGITRPALSREDLAGRAFLMDYAQSQGLTTWMDAAANLHFARVAERVCSEGSVVMTGSHIDSVPRGGHLDGALGVLAGIETLLALGDRGIVTAVPIEVVAFTDEEGRFGGMFGSEALCGVLDANVAEQVDDAGLPLRVVMEAIGLDACKIGDARRDLARIHAFVELHIEQGPVLDTARKQIGVVTGIAGLYKLRCRFRGFAAHAGTNPMPLRRDALVGMSLLHTRLPDLTRDDAVATIGRVGVTPNAANVIPGEVTFTLDLRATDAVALEALKADVLGCAASLAEARQLAFDYEELSRLEPVLCSPTVMDAIETAADRLGHSRQRMPSGAAHDAMNFAALDAVGMVFVPSIGGISHNTAERTADEDLIAGANVLANTLVAFAG